MRERSIMRRLAHMSMLHVTGTVPEWTVGDRLRKAREVAGLNQIELADELGISRRSVGNYEAGLRTPHRPVLVVWAMRCGVPLAWLEDDNGPRPGESDEGRVSVRHQGLEPRTRWLSALPDPIAAVAA